MPDDVKALAVSTLSHRIILGPGARLRNLTSDDVIEETVSQILVPGGDLQAA